MVLRLAQGFDFLPCVRGNAAEKAFVQFRHIDDFHRRIGVQAGQNHSGAKFRRFDVCQPDGGHIVFAGKFDQIVKMFLIGNPAVAVLVDGRKRKVVDCRSFDIGNRTVAGFKLSLKVFCRDVFGIVKSFVGGGSRIECAQRLFPY